MKRSWWVCAGVKCLRFRDVEEVRFPSKSRSSESSSSTGEGDRFNPIVLSGASYLRRIKQVVPRRSIGTASWYWNRNWNLANRFLLFLGFMSVTFIILLVRCFSSFRNHLEWRNSNLHMVTSQPLLLLLLPLFLQRLSRLPIALLIKIQME
jgi:hypothetical protein